MFYSLSYGIGHGFKFIPDNITLKASLHGIVSGFGNLMRGGNFKSGYMSAFFAKLAGGIDVGEDDWVQGTFQTLVGGTASEIGGGKFANGAVSAAVVYLFNDSAGTYPSEDEMIDGSGLKYNTWNPLKTGGDFIDGIASIGEGLYASGDFLARYSGFRDWQNGNIIGLYEFEAKIELCVTIEALKNDYTRTLIINSLKSDFMNRPFYYIGGLATGGILYGAKVSKIISFSTSVPIGVTKTFGSGMDYVHTEINPFH